MHSQPQKHLAHLILPKSLWAQARLFYGNYSGICESRPYLDVAPLDFLG